MSPIPELTRVNLETLPANIRECLVGLRSVGRFGGLECAEGYPASEFRDGKDILKVLREAREHQEQKIFTNTLRPQRQRLGRSRKTKPVKKSSRKTSKKSDETTDLEKSSPESFEPLPGVLVREEPQLREIQDAEEPIQASRSLWQWESPNTDYLGIGTLMF